ncbi:hypothetical protein DFA_04702 [Cavenderia fasciculata]|uniref:Yos1-like protein n=1 Tax=Cavenderia fasciculata TaxID=261658 RepID=F4PQA9_CACFS|nr:uncharacterized protein DFA_04702 [Cavenderia fasciculata]EGG22572.1 hypothetical protein DFA_04702 [Cavenderia fasciculata]|eukprot:XP_004360423.1 hypothetical protein DFA_04702 [Cavenderia fasciculata]
MFSLFGFLKSLLLFTNALAILNERFLNKIGWSVRNDQPMDYDSFKYKCVTLLYNLRFFFRLPLVCFNSIVIVFLLIFG